jgi:hypothetical protein
VAFGNGVFVGASGFEGDILTSADGTNWTVQTLVTNEGDYVYFRDLTFANGRFVAVDPSAIATSVDGTNWNLLRTNLYLSSVAGGAGRFVAVGGNTLATSTDGTNWVTQNSNDPGTLTDVAFGAGWFVVTTGPIYSKLRADQATTSLLDFARWDKLDAPHVQHAAGHGDDRLWRWFIHYQHRAWRLVAI